MIHNDLIKRLGQKLDVAFLDEDEQRAIGAGSRDRELDYPLDWVMFTRRSSAFSNASSSGETNASSGSSTVSEGTPARPLSAFKRTT